MTRPRPHRKLANALALLAVTTAAACTFDRAYRQAAIVAETPLCDVGALRCAQDALEECVPGLDGRAGFATKIDCAASQQTCASPALGCRVCVPGAATCAGPTLSRVDTCRADGSGWDAGPECTGQGQACRGGVCGDLCSIAAAQRSNVGCEYWAAQLDNARISQSQNATAQQYAVVVSNPQRDVAADVTVELDDAAPGEPADVRVVAKARVLPQNLEVFLLGPRWVDGAVDTAGTGETHTAVTRAAYKITSNVPIVAYQFNPLDNVNVFSNDASLLKPVEAIAGAARYVVAGWPQTIAVDDDPDKNFNLNLRNFLTIVGTRARTSVTVKTTAAIVGGGPVPAVPVGGTLNYTLDPFEVLNLETGGFHADFTGSIIEASDAVVVFSGSEASDAPHWDRFSQRSCCADHLEEQLDPARTAGRRYVLGRSPNRSRAVIAAGAGTISPVDEPEFVRVIAVAEGKVQIRTTLPPPDDSFVLDGPGGFREIVYRQDFALESDGAIHLVDLQASQDAAGVPRGLPGGDPSLLVVPPVEQFRADYVFLTPDKYAFDFVSIFAPKGTQLLFDGAAFEPDACEVADVAPAPSPITGKPTVSGWQVWRCQLSFPVIDTTQPSGKNVQPGRQNDGVHRLQASRPVGAVVYGFDSYVSYAYAAGTELTSISPR